MHHPDALLVQRCLIGGRRVLAASIRVMEQAWRCGMAIRSAELVRSALGCADIDQPTMRRLAKSAAADTSTRRGRRRLLPTNSASLIRRTTRLPRLSEPRTNDEPTPSWPVLRSPGISSRPIRDDRHCFSWDLVVLPKSLILPTKARQLGSHLCRALALNRLLVQLLRPVRQPARSRRSIFRSRATPAKLLPGSRASLTASRLNSSLKLRLERANTHLLAHSRTH